MKIGKKTRVKEFSRYKTMLFGVPGAGKTTLASKFPDAFFVPTEDGLNYLEVDTLLDDEDRPFVCKSWKDFTDAILMTAQIAKEKTYKTVIIDTIDDAFDLCRLHVFREQGWQAESDGAYGAGWSMVADEFNKWVKNYLLKLDIGVVLISHYEILEKEEGGIKRLYTDCSLNKKVRKAVTSKMDFAFYCHLNNDGERIMTCRENPNVFAKDRTGYLGDVLPMDFEVFKKKVSEAMTK